MNTPYSEAALIVSMALKHAEALGMESPILLGVMTSHGRMVVPVAADDPSDGPRFTDPEEATAWIGLADRHEAELAVELKRVTGNWDRFRQQVPDDLNTLDLKDLIEVASMSLRLGAELAAVVGTAVTAPNPFDEEDWS